MTNGNESEALGRFVYYPFPQIIEDRLTGSRYYGNRAIADLLNELEDEIRPIRKVCKEHRIPLEDLPGVLEEYIAYDNDDDW